MYCPNCGNKSFNVNYCPSCGTNLQSNKYNYQKKNFPGYNTPTVAANSANNKIHKQFVMVDFLPLLVVMSLIAVIILGMLFYVIL